MTGTESGSSSWVRVLVAAIAAAVGAVIGLIIGVIAATNFVISVVGHPDGYEAGPIEVFQYSPVGGIVNALILFGPPVLGGWLGWVVVHRAGRTYR